MNIIRKIISIILNPINSFTISNQNEKAAELFSKNTILIFVVALVITAIIFILGYQFI